MGGHAMIKHLHAVELESDFRASGKYWCKTFLSENQYDFKECTSVHSDTWLFETQVDADNFNTCIKKYFNIYKTVGVPGP